MSDEYESWSECSVTCGIGVKTRQKTIISSEKNGGTCENPIESKACEKGPCPCVQEWSNWSSCSVKCGTGTRSRNVNKIKDEDSGGACPNLQGDTTEVCSVDCNIGLIVGTIVGCIIIIVIFFLIYWKIEQILVYLKLKKKEVAEEADHIVLKKEPYLPQAITALVNDEKQLMEEFRKLEVAAQENYAFPTKMAQENMQHSRYKDMGKGY